MNKPPSNWTKHWGFARDFDLGDHDRIDATDYISAEHYEAEKEKIFRRLWLVVARVTEVSEPGDFVRRDIPTLDTHVVIVRDRKDGVIRAFYNACPHRGVALVAECSGKAGLFVCPYHGWSFKTDGQLQGMPGPENFPHVTKGKVGLTPIHCDVWNDHIFLNFSEAPEQTLEEYMGAFGELFDDLPFRDYGYAVDTIQDVPTNWKNFLDAFNEGYHVRVLHSKSLPAVAMEENPLTHMYDQALMPPHSRATIQRNVDYVPQGRVERFAFAPEGIVPPEKVAPGSAPPARSFLGTKGVNRIGLPSFSTELMNIFPLSQFHAFKDRYLWYQFWPMGPDRVIFVTRRYFARPPASYRELFSEAFLLARSRDVVSEDVSMTHIQQIGMKSGGLKHLHIGENEPLIRFNNLQVRKYVKGEA